MSLRRRYFSRDAVLLENYIIDNDLWNSLFRLHQINREYIERGDELNISDHVLAELGLAEYADDIKTLSIICESPDRYQLIKTGVFLEARLLDDNAPFAFTALHFANKYFRGMKRKDGAEEVSHSFSICRGAIALGIKRDEDLAKILLHDVIENTNVSLSFLARFFSDEIVRDVGYLSKKPGERIRVTRRKARELFYFIYEYYPAIFYNREILPAKRRQVADMVPELVEVLGRYYERMSLSDICLIIKIMDKIDIFRNAVISLDDESIINQIIELEALLFQAVKSVRQTHQEYSGLLSDRRDVLEKNIFDTLAILVQRESNLCFLKRFFHVLVRKMLGVKKRF